MLDAILSYFHIKYMIVCDIESNSHLSFTTDSLIMWNISTKVVTNKEIDDY